MARNQPRRLLAFGLIAALMTLGCTFGQDKKDDAASADPAGSPAAPPAGSSGGDSYAGAFPDLYKLAQASDNATFTAQYAVVWTKQGAPTNLTLTFVHKPGHTGLVIADGVFFTWTDTDMWACSRAKHA